MSKASKKRNCPAVARDISAAECGENRQSHYACPADCAHNPFAPANYGQLLELEGLLDQKCLQRLMESAPDRPAMDKALQQAHHHPNPHALHAWYAWQLFFATTAGGLTCCQRWEQGGLLGLKTDERVLLRAKMQMRTALLEIHRVVDGETVEAVDLLAPGSPPLRLLDRSFAGRAVRFAVLLGWVYPLAHYWRLHGTAVELPEIAQLLPVEIVSEAVRHLGGPVDPEPLRRWLAENFVRLDDVLQATAKLRRMRMFSGMDTRHGKAVYELRAPFAGCRQVLDELPLVEPDDLIDAERQEGFAEARVWFTDEAPSKPAVPAGGRAVLGRVLLGQAHWRLEAFGGDNFAQLRRQFEQCLGERVRFTGERFDDLGAKLSAHQPPVDEALVPPRLLEHPGQIKLASSRMPAPPANLPPGEVQAQLMHAADQAFLEDQVPALDNRTPREAARDPALRPRLIHLLKQRVRAQDQRNLASGRNDDINWLLRELGADEIISDPPPWRPPPPEPAREEEAEDQVDDLMNFGPDPNFPPAPPLPATPLDVEEAAKRLRAAMESFETAVDAKMALYDTGSNLIEEVDELTLDLLSEEEFAFALTFLLQAWFALSPPRHRAPKLDYARMAAAFESDRTMFEKCPGPESTERLIRMIESGPQPGLLALLSGQILRSGTTAPEDLRPDPGSLCIMIALVKAVVDELDTALRQRSLHPR